MTGKIEKYAKIEIVVPKEGDTLQIQVVTDDSMSPCELVGMLELVKRDLLQDTIPVSTKQGTSGPEQDSIQEKPHGD